MGRSNWTSQENGLYIIDKGGNADTGVKKGVLITIIILLLMFLFCIPIVLEWNVFNEFINGYAKGFLTVVIARKTADWIMGDKKDG